MLAILSEKCVGCGLCVTVCPEEALSVWALAAVDRQKCTDCLICVDYCPVEALEDKS
ncbi:MAG: 4Fe-4S binding protein [Dehalococcoidia bacterium]|nr:4Fe-4S binding protein [Dehalococcoidia bacterium]